MGFARHLSALIGCFLALSGLKSTLADDEYLIGTGIYDITGPAAQVNFMGYARASQTAHGIHQRLRARAYIVGLPQPTKLDDVAASSERSMASRWQSWWTSTTPTTVPVLDPSSTICFVSIDAGMGSDLLNMRVLKRLAELLPDGPCGLENLSISGTHTHSAPAGFIQYVLYQVTSLGFLEEVMATYVEGIAQSIKRAHDQLQPGSVTVVEDWLWEANINRSPSSYLLNPLEERNEYADEGDTDKRMLQLGFMGTNKPLGLLNWFAVHGTSMNSTNQLISGDNKGYASYLAEKWFNNGAFPGHGDFVAAFASTNLGDVSPNTNGPRCIDTGLPCDFSTSTCNGKTQLCIASGPGADMFESTEIIGRRQFDVALGLWNSTNQTRLEGPVASRHAFVDMSNLTVVLANGTKARTCSAALGYSFAGGTTDGPGDFDFSQGTNTSNPFWNMIGGFLSIPTEEQIACQAPKPILLNTGLATLPYDWDPNTVPISIFRVGRLFILNVPAELTTMAGRRLRKAVKSVLEAGGVREPILTIAGLANSYTHYVTTEEEYGGQRYEAASTLYGPHTLAGYIQEFTRIANDLVEGRPSETDAGPKDLSRYQLSLLTPVELDTIGFGQKFGSVAVEANDTYAQGDLVKVSFRSSNPRNNQRIEDTFLRVDILNENGTWVTQYVDGDWCTKFIWKGTFWGTSFAEIHWKIPEDEPQGIYRICHFGTRKTLLAYAEAALYRAPGWLRTNIVGSYALSILMGAVELSVELSEGLQSMLYHQTGRSRLRDFQGCTKTFLVRTKFPE